MWPQVLNRLATGSSVCPGFGGVRQYFDAIELISDEKVEPSKKSI